MGSVGNNQNNPWAPYDTYKDCSQGICTIYCPQWCYIIFPPPPFGPSDDEDDDSGADFSPLIIAIIGILASALLLLSYYTIISKYCRRRSDREASTELDEYRDQGNAEQWQGGSTGLDESAIRSITVFKYKHGDGFIEGTDCSVCLSEFREDENLRLMPKCNHAFHLPCIDTWLKSHSSCPLCRSNIAVADSLPESRSHVSVSALEYQYRNDTVLVIPDPERGGIPDEEAVVTLVTDDQTKDRTPIRRSVSFNSSLFRGPVSIADILRVAEDDDEFQLDDPGSSNRPAGGQVKTEDRRGLLHLPLDTMRSVSTGRFVSTRYGTGKNPVIIPS